MNSLDNALAQEDHSSMSRMRTIALATTFLLAATGLHAQSVISARSGLIHYVEGQVYLADAPVTIKSSTYPEVKENLQLRTGDGRAEVLLNPGVFLRVGENSVVRMVSSKLSDTRLEFISGSVVIESSESLADHKENAVAILYKDAAVHLRKSGIYRFDSEPEQLRVFAGEADVESAGTSIAVRSGRQVQLNGPIV